MRDEPLFTTLDASRVQGDLLDLLCRTARYRGRVEITNCDGDSCVMISKAELDGLERALEILSATDGARTMREAIAQFAIRTTSMPVSTRL